MARLIGRHLNKIDKKGRVSVPKTFREAMLAQGFAGIYVFPYFKHSAIQGAGPAFMDRLEESLLDGYELYDPEQEELATIILESAHQLMFDPEGRVSLPKELMEHAGLTDQALFAGQGATFYIWAPETYDAHRKGAIEAAKARGATLKLSKRQSGEG